ncbi:hypothetical protein [Bacteroides sp.]|uniref:hypothetical protein n=1 Tax=Bacteroides sp. TaxID=29523 RepID=UPI00258D5380|nr:hypothetical protein [Bacteroides sp.]
MKEIGGYFELELQTSKDKLFDKHAVYVNSGRNAFEYIIKSLPKVSKLWLPYFTCSSLQEPLHRLNLNVEYYSINDQLEINNINTLCLGGDDYLLYTNYFGVKNSYVELLQARFSNHLIVDNSQALFSNPSSYCFYSPRKFVGIPDGGIAFSKFDYQVKEQDKKSYERCSHLLKRYDFLASEGYVDFKTNGLSLSHQELKIMSNLTKAMFESIDFLSIKETRNRNFKHLHSSLQSSNSLLMDIDVIDGALVYPYLIEHDNLRQKLIDNKIYVATYWPNILKCKSEETEYKLAKYLLPLPIDQRYTNVDIERILSIILE